MSNQPIKNNSKLLYLQAKYEFDKAMKAFEDGSIKTEPKMIQQVFGSFQSFFTSMGKPQMIPRYAPEQGPPWSEDYNSMMDEIKNDLELLFQEVDILGRALYTDFNHNIMQHDMIEKEYNDITDKLRDLEIYSGFAADGTLKFGRDDFLNGKKIDFDKITGIPLDISGGGVTLMPKGDPVNVAKNAKITIVTGNRSYNSYIIGADSNGFPGNNTEVNVVADPLLSSSSSYSFVGKDNNHGNYGSVIDGNPNTWFEYERIGVREHEKIRIAKNLGWNYQVHEDKTLPFAEEPDNGSLRLHLQMVLDETKIINQINVNMFTPPNYGSKPAKIKNILVSNGTDAPQSILSSSRKDDDYVFHFPPIEAKVISVLFEQPQKYYTDIGHIYYEKKMNVQNDKDYVFDTISKQYKPKYSPRIDGPLISLEDLGVKIDVGQSDINAYYPFKGMDEGSFGIQDAINQLTTRINLSNIDMGVERFEGWRYCIGVRDIEVLSCEYETEGELVTQPFFFDKPLDKISLSVNETLKGLFEDNVLMKYDWIKYYVSIDDGAEWHPITPLEHEVISEDQPPKIYTVQKVTSSTEGLDYKYGYLESQYPVYSLRLKVLLKRMESGDAQAFAFSSSKNTSFMSPSLQNYTFSVETAADEFNSEASNRKAVFSSEDLPSGGGDVFGPGTGGGVSPGQGNGSDSNSGYDPNDPLNPGGGTGGSGNNGGSGGDNPGGSGGSGGTGGTGGTGGSGENQLSVSITNKKTMWCLDQDLPVEGVAKGPRSISKVEYYINNSLFDSKPGGSTVINFSFVIPKGNLVNGQNLTVLVKAYDSMGSVQDINIIPIIDCTGLPPETGTSISVKIDNKVSTICVCDDLLISGVISGPNPIRSQKLLINNVVVDPMNLGEEPADNPCGISGASAQSTTNTFSTMSSSESAFNWTIPYWKLIQLGGSVGNSFDVKVIGSDGIEIGEDSYSVSIQDCTPVIPPKVNSCFALDSVLVEYYSELTSKIEKTEIPINVLPTEINNGEGTILTVGVDNEFKSVVAMITKGQNKTGAAFQLHAIGIRYRDFDNISQTNYASLILKQSPNNKNTELMLDNPSQKDPTPWINAIKNGNYSTAPSLGGLNDYIVFGINADWNTNACELNFNFKPEDHETDPNQPQDPNRPKIKHCKTIKKIAFQHYNDAIKQLEIYQIPLNDNYKTTYQVTGKNGVMDVLVGWYERFNGPMISVRKASGTNNLLLTSLGLVYEDEYGELLTTWIEGITYKTTTVKNTPLMIGDPKALDTLTWVSQVDAGTYTNAPRLGSQGSTVAGSINAGIVNTLCAVDKPLDNSPDLPPIDTTPPSVAVNSNAVCYTDLTNGSIPITGTISDGTNVDRFEVYRDGAIVLSKDTDVASLNFSELVPYTMPAANSDGRYPDQSVLIIVKAYDLNGLEGQAQVIVNLKDCSPPPVQTQPCGVSTQAGGSGITTTMHQLGTTAGTVTISYDMFGVPDALDVYYKDNLVASTNGYVSNGGNLTFNYAPTNGVNEIKVVVTGNSSGTSWNYTVNCPVAVTPPPSQAEKDITNTYDLLFRLRWGNRTSGGACDLDFYAYIDKQPSKVAWHGARTFSEGTDAVYLNADYTGHTLIDSWEREVEIITVNGFVNRKLTLVVNRYNNVNISDLDRDPQVEIVDKATGNILKTIVLSKTEFTNTAMIVCDINLKGAGQTTLADILVRKELRASATPI